MSVDHFYKFKRGRYFENTCKDCRKAAIVKRQKGRKHAIASKPPVVRKARERTRKPAQSPEELRNKRRIISRRYYLKTRALKPRIKLTAEEKRNRASIRNKNRIASETPDARAKRLANKKEANRKYHARMLRLRRDRYKNDILYRLHMNTRAEVRRQLVKGNKSGRRLVDGLGYTIDKLREHLERQFTRKMSWTNYGTFWHIDHIRPISSFNILEFGDDEFKACWALSNLRPLEKKANIIKRDKITHLL